MASDKQNLNGKLQIGTGDIDESMTVGSNSTVTTNNDTRIKVEDGGVLHYKDAAAVKAEHEQRREDVNHLCEKAGEIGQKLYEHTLTGKIEKGFKDFEAGMDKICGCKSSRFDTATTMGPVVVTTPDSQISK